MERLLPCYRERYVSTLARALVDHDYKTIDVALKVLRPSDIARAHRKATELERKLDAGLSVQAAAKLIAAPRSIWEWIKRLLIAAIIWLK